MLFFRVEGCGNFAIVYKKTVMLFTGQGRQTGGGGVGGVSTPPPLNFGWGG